MGKAKSKGQLPQSQELTAFASITLLVFMVWFSGSEWMQWFSRCLEEGVNSDISIFRDTGAFIGFANEKIVDVTKVMFPTLLVLCVGGVISSIVVSGLNFAPGAIQFKLEQISPGNGLSKLVNGRSLVKLGLSVVKLVFVGVIVWVYIEKKLDLLASLRWAWSFELLGAIMKIILGLMIRVCIALLVIGVADMAYQKWKWMKDLKMTKQEVKEERKQTEGSPEVKNRIRKIQFQTVLKRITQEVPKANVVLVNPTHYAVALKYDAKTMEAPEVVAKGADHIAHKIMEVARAYGVPVVRRPELARTLYATTEPGEAIPDALYVAVAEVLAMIYRLRRQRRG